MLAEGVPAHPPSSQTRPALLRHAERLSAISVGYNVLEGLIAIGAGIAAGSAALSGFGFDSVIEVTSAAVLWRRLRAERLGRVSDAGVQAERGAARIAGALLLFLAAGLLVESARQLILRLRPEISVAGLVLTALSAVVMPLLARRKLQAARALGSRALRADAHETVACAWMSATTLLGLGLNAAAGWWWADPSAAALLVPLIAREGWEAVRGGESCEGRE